MESNLYLLIQGDVARLPLADQSVDLVFGSPPYCDARTYGIGADRGCAAWVEWMLGVTAESLRVSRGPVVWVAAGVTRDRTYWPACEGLMWRWWSEGGSLYRPCYWHRVGVPGSGGRDWFRSDIEHAMCFKRPGALAWSDNTACGHPPKYRPGGAIANRLKNGKREIQGYTPPARANPGNLIKTIVGGGLLGHPLAHANEAPFPEALVEFFLKSLCPPGGTVLDPFSGSGTTVAVATRLARHGIGLDVRRSQAEIAWQRLERPHAAVVKSNKKESFPLFK
jgi:site-specific DNA-methyltransferase (adenine-specific)/site-specific DNA-methyltransferase (cytosine-N4-specific)